MFWLIGVTAVPVLLLPAKIRSVVAELEGAVPVFQLPPVLQLRFPPFPFQVQINARAL